MSVDAPKPIPDHVEMVRNVEAKKEFNPETVHEEITKLPGPTGYRLLILPFSQKTVTKGGIHLADSYVEKERLATNVGFVISLGPDAFLTAHGVRKKIGLFLADTQEPESK